LPITDFRTNKKAPPQAAPSKRSVTEILVHMAEGELSSTWRYRQMLEQKSCAAVNIASHAPAGVDGNSANTPAIPIL